MMLTFFMTRDLTRAILDITQNSIRVAREKIAHIDGKKLGVVVAHDIYGALEGAGAGGIVGAAFAFIGAPVGIVLGAILGAASGSVIGVADNRG
jgi:hypothetical protein